MTFSFTGSIALIRKVLAMAECLNQTELVWHRVLMLSKDVVGTPSANKKKASLMKTFNSRRHYHLFRKRVDDYDFHGIEHNSNGVVLYAGFVNSNTCNLIDRIVVMVKFVELGENQPKAEVKVDVDQRLTRAKILTAKMLALLLVESDCDGFLRKAENIGTYLVSLGADTRQILL